MRLDAALAWRLAIIAIVITACRVLWLFVALWEPIAWISDLVVPQVVAAAPVLLVIALVAAVRERGFLPEPHALLAACVGALASAAVSLAWVSWSIGFDAADAHRLVPLAGQLFVPLLLCATPVTLIAVSIVTDELSVGLRMGNPGKLLTNPVLITGYTESMVSRALFQNIVRLSNLICFSCLLMWQIWKRSSENLMNKVFRRPF